VPRHFSIKSGPAPAPPNCPVRRHTIHTPLPTMRIQHPTRTPPAPMAAAAMALLLAVALLASAAAAAASPSDAEAISRFQEYLRIDTAQPAPNYAAAMDFLRAQAAAAELQAQTLELVAGKPLLLLKWPGRRPSLPSILINSHTDVVPSEPQKWDHPPLSAAIDEATGHIYARGSQVTSGLFTCFAQLICTGSIFLVICLEAIF
jgi:aminoacylase